MCEILLVGALCNRRSIVVLAGDKVVKVLKVAPADSRILRGMRNLRRLWEWVLVNLVEPLVPLLRGLRYRWALAVTWTALVKRPLRVDGPKEVVLGVSKRAVVELVVKVGVVVVTLVVGVVVTRGKVAVGLSEIGKEVVGVVVVV